MDQVTKNKCVKRKHVTELDGLTYCASIIDSNDKHILEINPTWKRGLGISPCKMCERNSNTSGGSGWGRHGTKTMTSSEGRRAYLCKTNICQICKKYTSRPHRDHDPKTGLFRGWLCNTCNQSLSLFDHYYEATMTYLAVTRQQAQASPEQS